MNAANRTPLLAAKSGSRDASVLVIDTDEAAIRFVVDQLSGAGVLVHTAKGLDASIAKFETVHPNLVLVSAESDEQRGRQILGRLLDRDPRAMVILTSMIWSSEEAMEAIRYGAVDYMGKPLRPEHFLERVLHWIRDTGGHVSSESERTWPQTGWMGIIGVSEEMRGVFRRIQRFSPHFQTVLVRGETGTGKELVARAFHLASPRKQGTYLICNCAAIAESLVESELFGHVKGSFTGASQDQLGLIAAAEGGTVFLDEVGELPLAAQAKLLRVLQTGEVRPVGSSKTRQVDVRFVAATNRDLRKMVAQGQFREDLYYRLSILELELPPLRERRGDIPMLARYFLRQFGELYRRPAIGLNHRAMDLLESYQWPGNVRQLENAIGSAVLLAETDVVNRHHFPREFEATPLRREEKGIATLEEVTRNHAQAVMAKCDGNRRKAAEALGISRATLYRLLREIKTLDLTGVTQGL